jgi:hypothetical protein
LTGRESKTYKRTGWKTNVERVYTRSAPAGPSISMQRTGPSRFVARPPLTVIRDARSFRSMNAIGSAVQKVDASKRDCGAWIVGDEIVLLSRTRHVVVLQVEARDGIREEGGDEETCVDCVSPIAGLSSRWEQGGGGGGGGGKDEPKRRLLFSFAPSCPVRIRMREIVGMPYVRKTAISSDLRETQGISYDARVCQMYCARM